MPSDVGANLPWNFALKRSYWRRSTDKQASIELPEDAHLLSVDSETAVAICKLTKIFETTDRGHKVAVDSLDLNVAKNEITGLLGQSFACIIGMREDCAVNLLRHVLLDDADP